MVDRGGFEPPKSKTSDLQSDPFGRSGICPILYAFLFRGISVTCRRKGWCLKVESNRRQRDFQSLALPTELSRQDFFLVSRPVIFRIKILLLNRKTSKKMATQTRLELVTSSVTGWRSNQLSYWAVFILKRSAIFGGPSRIRTADQSVMSRQL